MSSSFNILFSSPRITPKNIPKGFTLIELMITIAVAAIVMTVAIPSLSYFTVKLRIDNEMSQLRRLVLSARSNAVSLEENTIICPLSNTGECTADWNNEITAFADIDNNGEYTAAADTILKIKRETGYDDTLTYAGQSSIAFAPTGRLSTNESTFIYCPKAENKLARALVLFPSGRSYLTSDEDDNGRDNLRNAGDVVCP